MVAEALCALDRADAVMPWIDAYRNRLLPRSAEGSPVERADWRAGDTDIVYHTLYSASLPCNLLGIVLLSRRLQGSAQSHGSVFHLHVNVFVFQLRTFRKSIANNGLDL